MMADKGKKITMNISMLSEENLEKVDKMVSEGNYNSRAELIRDLLFKKKKSAASNSKYRDLCKFLVKIFAEYEIDEDIPETLMDTLMEIGEEVRSEYD